jgi:hypothetical protein
MSAPVRHPLVAENTPKPSDKFAVRCFVACAEARALLWKCCEFDLHEAVDVLQHAAVRIGLVEAIGQDRVQALLADAFRDFRRIGIFDDQQL